MAKLHKHIDCKKNPGHVDFIPVGNFNIDHLPAEYADKWRVDMVKAMSEITVHIKVHTVSQSRPEFYPGSIQPYPFHTPGGGTRPRTASGFVYRILKCGENGYQLEGIDCQCFICTGSPSPKKTWWKVVIRTCTHVIFDDSEVRSAEVKFFFDASDSATVNTNGHEVLFSNADSDTTDFVVIIHDEATMHRLELAWNRYRELRRNHKWHDLVVIVSHPHGCSKHVTVGKFVREDHMPEGPHAVYTTSTCPGSAGALVWAGRWEEVWEEGGICRHGTFHHSESLRDGTNRSAPDRWGLL